MQPACAGVTPLSQDAASHLNQWHKDSIRLKGDIRGDTTQDLATLMPLCVPRRRIVAWPSSPWGWGVRGCGTEPLTEEEYDRPDDAGGQHRSTA